MEIDPHTLPVDDPRINEIPARAIMHEHLIEWLHDKVIDKIIGNTADGEQRRGRRMALLLMKYHQVGSIQLPIPTLFALKLIQQLSREDLIAFILESVFILRNQHNEDLLFLRGDQRQIAIATSTRDISAAQMPDALIAVNEIIEGVQKKTSNYSQNMLMKIQNLMKELASCSSPNPTDSPSATGSTN